MLEYTMYVYSTVKRSVKTISGDKYKVICEAMIDLFEKKIKQTQNQTLCWSKIHVKYM